MHRGYYRNTRQLALVLREGKVPRREMRFLLASGALATFAVLFLIWIRTVFKLLAWYPSQYTMSSVLAVIAVPVVTFVGFLVCYQANSRRDGKDFVVRFICMSWPVGWRVLTTFFVLGLVFFFPLSAVAPAHVDPLADLMGVGITVAYFALIRKWLIEISSAEISN